MMSDNLLLWLKKQVFRPGEYVKVEIAVEDGKVVWVKQNKNLNEDDLKKLLTST